MSIRVVLYRYYSCLKNIMICFSFLFIFLSDNLFYPIEEKEGRTLDDNKKKNDELFLLFTVPYASISLFFTLALVRSVPFASLSLSRLLIVGFFKLFFAALLIVHTHI